MVRDVEEIGGVKMRDEHRVHRGIGDVFIGDAGHGDGEAGAHELALPQEDFAGGEPYGAAVVIEEIAAGPADDALGGVEPEDAIRNGRLRQFAVAFRGLPFGEPAVEWLHLRVAGGAEFFRTVAESSNPSPAP
ncbi:MAG: hypothetical protein ABIZ56_09855 [Chthoniobacteraceae bacterium]